MRTRLEIFTEIQLVDSRAAELREMIARAKGRAYTRREYEKPEVFAGWQREMNDIKRKRQMLQFEMGEVTRAERRKDQDELDRAFAEKLAVG
jgi:hypothetical protein